MRAHNRNTPAEMKMTEETVSNMITCALSVWMNFLTGAGGLNAGVSLVTHTRNISCLPITCGRALYGLESFFSASVEIIPKWSVA